MQLLGCTLRMDLYSYSHLSGWNAQAAILGLYNGSPKLRMKESVHSLVPWYISPGCLIAQIIS